HALGAGDRKGRSPGAVDERFDRIGRRRQGRAAIGAAGPGEALPDLVAKDLRRRLRLLDALGRDGAMQALGQQTAGLRILDPVEHLAQDAKARRHEPARIARVNAFAQDLDLERAADDAAQARRQPELVVVAGAAVEADDEADLAEPSLQGIDVERQVGRAAFLAGLDDADAARPGDTLPVERLDRGDRGIDRIAVVGTAAAVETAIFVARRPGAEAALPAIELGLLVEGAGEAERRGGGVV